MAMVAEVTESITSAPVCVVADAYFSKATFFNALIEKHISLVTRLRWDAVGFDAPVYCGRGRPPKRGKKWKLATLIDCLPSKQLTVRLTANQRRVQLWLGIYTYEQSIVKSA